MAEVSVTPELWQDDGTKVSLATPRNVDFASLIAKAMATDNGETFPTPAEGMLFLFGPPGLFRRVLYQYQNGTWQPIVGSGELHVSKSGSDANNGSTYARYLTIQKAIDNIPPIYIGDFYVHVYAGDYAENITIQGKVGVGGGRIIVYHHEEAGVGTYQALTTLSARSIGSNTLQPTITLSSVPATGEAVVGGIVKFNNNNNSGEFRVITDVVGSVLTLTGGALGAYTAGDSVSFSSVTSNSNATHINIQGTLIIGAGQSNVLFQNIRFTNSGGSAATIKGGSHNFDKCFFQSTASGFNTCNLSYCAGVTFSHCGIVHGSSSGTAAVWAEGGDFAMTNCYVGKTSATTGLYGVRILYAGEGFIYGGTVIGGTAGTTLAQGVVGTPGTAALYGGSPTGTIKVRNCGVGINGEYQLTASGMHSWVTFGVAGAAAGANNTTDCFPLIVETGVGVRRTVAPDNVYTARPTDDLIVYPALTWTRILTLPPAAAMGAGKVLTVKDESGAAGPVANSIYIWIDPDGSETIDGASDKKITTAYGFVRCYSDGTKWFTIGAG